MRRFPFLFHRCLAAAARHPGERHPAGSPGVCTLFPDGEEASFFVHWCVFAVGTGGLESDFSAFQVENVFIEPRELVCSWKSLFLYRRGTGVRRGACVVRRISSSQAKRGGGRSGGLGEGEPPFALVKGVPPPPKAIRHYDTAHSERRIRGRRTDAPLVLMAAQGVKI